MRNYTGLLCEYLAALERRGIYHDETLRWYVKDYPRGILSEDIFGAYLELGEKLRILHTAMTTAYWDRSMWG